MNTQDTKRMSRRKARRRTELAAVLVILFLVAAAAGLLSTRYIATTMRLLNAVGVVEIEDNEGKPRAAVENVRFQSGEAMRTGEESLASISLDSSKIITMDENSRVEFKKRLNHIELLLTEGGLLFDVSKKLRDNETFDIRTSTMAVGIRGTIGYVYEDPENQETTLWMLESVCEVVGINPVTGETKTVRVSAGQKVHTYLFNDREKDSIIFEIEEFTWEDLPRDVQEIIESGSVGDNLSMRVMGACGWADDSAGNSVGEAARVQPEAAETALHVHNFVKYSAMAASCTSGGTTKYICGCGEKLITNTDPLGHSLTKHAAVEATCMSGGNFAYWTCSRCGKYFADASGSTETTEESVKTPKGSHSLEYHGAAEATCEAEGNTEYWTCST